MKLARRLGEFEYDERQTFRGWLHRITENAVIDFLREQRTKGGGREIANGLEMLE